VSACRLDDVHYAPPLPRHGLASTATKMKIAFDESEINFLHDNDDDDDN